MIPEFPLFKKVDISDCGAIENHTRHFPYYSDFNFTSLWCWDMEHEREVSELNGNLVVKFTDYGGGDPFLSFLGIHKSTETTLALLNYAESIGLPPAMRLVPEISIHDLDLTNLQISPDFDNFDYVYLIEKMLKFNGNQYKSKRKALTHFTEAHPDHSFEVLNLANESSREYVRTISESWRKLRGVSEDEESLLHEITAIENIFMLADVRELFLGIVSINNKPVAYTIEEVVNKIFSIGHFWKIAIPVEGLYEFLAQQTAAYLDNKEVVYWNWEQDLGIETLRASKSSYRPSDFLKKFIVTRKLID